MDHQTQEQRSYARTEILRNLEAVVVADQTPELEFCEQIVAALTEYFGAEDAEGLPGTERRAIFGRFFDKQALCDRTGDHGPIARTYQFGFECAEMYLREQLAEEPACLGFEHLLVLGDGLLADLAKETAKASDKSAFGVDWDVATAIMEAAQ